MDRKPYVGIFISIIAVSFASIFILSCESPPLTIALYRLIFTTLLLLPVLFFTRTYRNEFWNVPRFDLCIMMCIGIILAAHFAFWVTSLTKTSVASSVILVTAHPIIVAPIAHYVLKEKLRPINILGITLSVSGVIILVSGNYSNNGLDSLEGNILAILGGVAAGLYILGGRKLRKTTSVVTYAVIVYSIAAILLFLLCLFFHQPIIPVHQNDYIIIFFMALISGVFGHTLYNWSLRYIPASVASVSLLGEPIGSSLLAYLIPWISQQPSSFTLFGGTIILLGIYLTARQKQNNFKK